MYASTLIFLDFAVILGWVAQCLSRRTISIEILWLQIRFLKSHMTFKGHTGLIGPTGTFSK